MARKALTSRDLVKRIGISLRQLYYWELRSEGAIKPKLVELGRRTYKRYSEKDAQLIQNIKELVDEGYTLQWAITKAREKSQRKGH